MKKVVYAPLVSVIIPNYNHFKYLEQRLDSVFNQTFQDFEVIIIDDCSSDNSIVILNKYKNHPKVSHFILNEKNSGSPFMQWKKGIKLAKGKFIWIAETDDFAATEFLETTVKALQNNQNSNLVYVDSKIVDDEGNGAALWSILKNKRFKTTKWSSNYENSGKEELIHFLLYSTTINNASAVLFRKSSLENRGFLKQLSNFKTAGDLFTYTFVALQGDISYIAKPLNNYREHIQNVTKKNTRSGVLYLERIRCFENVLAQLEQANVTQKESRHLKKGYKYILMKNGFRLAGLGFQTPLKGFVKKIAQSQLISRYESYFYIFFFELYSLKSELLKKISKKILKKAV